MKNATSGKNSTGEAIIWSLADMLLVAGAMSALVKAQGVAYPAFQLVFIRALIGLIFILPLIWRERQQMLHIRHPWRNLTRIVCNAIALTSQFFAYALMPLVVVNALSFSRPLVTMLMAVVMLSEKVSRIQWIGAGIAFGGVLIMLNPSGGFVWSVGLAAIAINVVFGSLATIQTRQLREESTTVMMVFYTVGLVVLTAIPAIMTWQPVKAMDWIPLIGIGLLAQAGQYCFLRAYRLADASVLAPISYLSIVVMAITGYVFFGDVPELKIIIGSAIVLCSLQLTSVLERRAKKKN
ncbi:DMT family transporter [Paenochrobactrum sp. BZR 588]|uniref:DMT family transporter n=1 Tax=Paenochrobactrum sp. BZR 588 TaxID=3378076 RepID=UPI0038522A6A